MVGDFLHHGHINIIEEGRKFGDVIVGLLTDRAVASYKRLPVFTFEQRKKIVENVKGVTSVMPQDSLDYIPNLKKLKPNYVIHGDDWRHGVQKKIRSEAIKCLKEIQRVGKGKSFITLASYEDQNDFWLFKQWSLLGTTILHKDEWKELLKHTNYSGDYFFTNAKYLNLVLKK